MTRKFTTTDLEALLAEWEGVTLTPSVETSPAFDDDPDQRDVSFPVIRVEGVEGWSSIGVPERLVGLSAMPGLVADYLRVRRELERTRAGLQDTLDLLEHVNNKTGDHLSNRVGRGYTRTHLKRITNILNGDSHA